MGDIVEALGFWGLCFVLFFGGAFTVGLSAIVTSGVVTAYRMRIKHVERMALIEHGGDPGEVERAYRSERLIK